MIGIEADDRAASADDEWLSFGWRRLAGVVEGAAKSGHWA
jgi:hypothetical protein